MNYAITTRYVAPTDTEGPRVQARHQGHGLELAWDHALSTAGNHRAAAMALAESLNRPGPWQGGCLEDGSYVFTEQCVDWEGPHPTVEGAVHSLANACEAMLAKHPERAYDLTCFLTHLMKFISRPSVRRLEDVTEAGERFIMVKEVK